MLKKIKDLRPGEVPIYRCRIARKIKGGVYYGYVEGQLIGTNQFFRVVKELLNNYCKKKYRRTIKQMCE